MDGAYGTHTHEHDSSGGCLVMVLVLVAAVVGVNVVQHWQQKRDSESQERERMERKELLDAENMKKNRTHEFAYTGRKIAYQSHFKEYDSEGNGTGELRDSPVTRHKYEYRCKGCGRAYWINSWWFSKEETRKILVMKDGEDYEPSKLWPVPWPKDMHCPGEPKKEAGTNTGSSAGKGAN